MWAKAYHCAVCDTSCHRKCVQKILDTTSCGAVTTPQPNRSSSTATLHPYDSDGGGTAKGTSDLLSGSPQSTSLRASSEAETSTGALTSPSSSPGTRRRLRREKRASGRKKRGSFLNPRSGSSVQVASVPTRVSGGLSSDGEEESQFSDSANTASLSSHPPSPPNQRRQPLPSSRAQGSADERYDDYVEHAAAAAAAAATSADGRDDPSVSASLSSTTSAEIGSSTTPSGRSRQSKPAKMKRHSSAPTRSSLIQPRDCASSADTAATIDDECTHVDPVPADDGSTSPRRGSLPEEVAVLKQVRLPNLRRPSAANEEEARACASGAPLDANLHNTALLAHRVFLQSSWAPGWMRGFLKAQGALRSELAGALLERDRLRTDMYRLRNELTQLLSGLTDGRCTSKIDRLMMAVSSLMARVQQRVSAFDLQRENDGDRDGAELELVAMQRIATMLETALHFRDMVQISNEMLCSELAAVQNENDLLEDQLNQLLTKKEGFEERLHLHETFLSMMDRVVGDVSTLTDLLDVDPERSLMDDSVLVATRALKEDVLTVNEKLQRKVESREMTRTLSTIPGPVSVGRGSATELTVHLPGLSHPLPIHSSSSMTSLPSLGRSASASSHHQLAASMEGGGPTSPTASPGTLRRRTSRFSSANDLSSSGGGTERSSGGGTGGSAPTGAPPPPQPLDSATCKWLPPSVPGGPPQLRAADINTVVAQLTHPSVLDMQLSRAFLLTYRTYLSPTELMEKLILRFFITLEVPFPPEEQIQAIDRTIRLPVQLRVLNLIKTWLEDHPHDFREDTSLCTLLGGFLDNPLVKNEQFRKSLRQLLSDLLAERSRPRVSTLRPAPRPELIDAEVLRQGAFSVENVPPLELARQLTMLQHTAYCQIRSKEFLGMGWSKSQKEQSSPNILYNIRRFNAIGHWVSCEVLRAESLQQRCDRLRLLIQLAQHCRSMNNFAGVFAIVSGLTHSTVHRLRRTFTELSDSERATFEDLRLLLSSEKNRKVYRTSLANAIPPCVPYLGSYLADLTFATDGLPDYVDGKLINVTKSRRVGTIIAEMQSFQQEQYNFVAIPELQHFLNVLPDPDAPGALSESDMRQLSVRLENKKLNRIFGDLK